MFLMICKILVSFWERFFSDFCLLLGSILDRFWRQIWSKFRVSFSIGFLSSLGPILEPKWSHFGAQKCSVSELVTFQKHMFSFSKTIVFEVGGSLEHEKNESGSDLETKLNFRAFLDRFWS